MLSVWSNPVGSVGELQWVEEGGSAQGIPRSL